MDISASKQKLNKRTEAEAEAHAEEDAAYWESVMKELEE